MHVPILSDLVNVVVGTGTTLVNTVVSAVPTVVDGVVNVLHIFVK